MNYNISQSFTDVAARFPDRMAIISRSGTGYKRWTFKDLDCTAAAYAHGFAAQGISRGDRVMLMVKPSMDFVCLTFSLFMIGAVVILIDPGMGYRNLLKCIGSVKPQVLVGIQKAQIFKRLFKKPFQTVETDICVGAGFGLLGKSLKRIADFKKGAFRPAVMNQENMAAIVFTTGSTGPPKGVQYQHGIFRAQLDLIRDYYGITPEDIDQPAFPPFALFSTALGACAVIPDMNPAHPARVDPAGFVRTILDNNVTYSFGSPAIWNVVSRYCLNKGITLPTIKKILMAGAPVPWDLIKRVKSIMGHDSEIHTPYGATESLPVSSMRGSEILNKTWEKTRTGHGTCVGRPLPGIEIKIISISDDPLESWDKVQVLPVGKIGEIVVRGDVVTRAYYNNNRENRLSKIRDGETQWHRIGDLGYMDDQGRLWFCGRKAHRVITTYGTLFTIPCEAIFNEHPLVFRSALVGVRSGPDQRSGPGPSVTGPATPVLIVEPYEKVTDPDRLFSELRDMANSNSVTKSINHFLIIPAMPVDIRHNAKIFREKLAVWAAERL